jgi:cell division protein FtsL
MSQWVFSGASSTGTSHKTTKTPCQDAFQISQKDDWLAMVVSDGAGTAKYADKGSQFVSKFFSEALIALSLEIDQKGPGSWVTDFLVQKITEIRSQFREMANSDRLNDYHSTLVACLLGKNGGFLIQIGDGAIFGGGAKKEKDKTQLAVDSFISPPENGEYANETFFITENSWIRHLRVTPVSKVEWICLGTDGGMALAMEAEKEVKAGFIEPLFKILTSQKDQKKREEELVKILSAEEANKLTGDDKTLCIAYRNTLDSLPNEFQYGSGKKPQPSQETKQQVQSVFNTTAGKEDQSNAEHPSFKKLNLPHINLKYVYIISGLFIALVITIIAAFLLFQEKVGIIRMQEDALKTQHEQVIKEDKIDNSEKKSEKEKTKPEINQKELNTPVAPKAEQAPSEKQPDPPEEPKKETETKE